MRRPIRIIRSADGTRFGRDAVPDATLGSVFEEWVEDTCR